MPIALDALFAGLKPAGIVTVAVSGGGDSMALLVLANAWARKNDIDLHAITVNHGLRPEAQAEAAFVAHVCFGLAIDHTILCWDEPKPDTGLPQAARLARYELIEDHARAIGSDLVLVAHTADDQAETLAMRLKRPAGGHLPARMPAQNLGRGLAGMEATSRLPHGTLLARPLLAVPRAELRGYLRHLGQSWVEDPSNEDEAYERVRVRKQLAGDPRLSARLIRLGQVVSRYRAVLSRDAAALLAAGVTVRPGPVFEVDLDLALLAPGPAAVLALQTAIAMAGGAAQLAPRPAIEPLLRAPGPRLKLTAGGAVIERTGNIVRIYRETRNLPSGSLRSGESWLWDGRLEINNEGPGVVHVGPLGEAGLKRLVAQGSRRLGPEGEVRPRAALCATPLLRCRGRDWMPLVEDGQAPRGLSVKMVCRAIEHFCPQSDFILRDWVRSVAAALGERLASRQ